MKPILSFFFFFFCIVTFQLNTFSPQIINALKNVFVIPIILSDYSD